MLDTTYEFIHGVKISLATTTTSRVEASYRAGVNTFKVTLCQVGQGVTSTVFINKAFHAAQVSRLSFASKSLILYSPVVLSLLKKSNLVPNKILPFIAFSHEHISKLYQIANLVSSIALLYFGQPFFAVPSLCIWTIGVLDQKELLPCSLRQGFHSYTPTVLMITGLITGDWLERICILMYGLSSLKNSFVWASKNVKAQFSIQKKLTPSIAIRLLNHSVPLSINKKYVHYNSLPEVPNIDVQTLLEKFDQINWNKHVGVLRQKLKQDLRFLDHHKNVDVITDHEIIRYAKNSLEKFVTTIKEKRILEGEPKDYEKLHAYLKLITKHLEEQEAETIKTDILFRLAVEGGGYCGPGKFEVAESIFAQTLKDNPSISFEDKIFYCLQDARNAYIHEFYYKSVSSSISNKILSKVIDHQDIHFYNTFINLYGDSFGLRKAAADNDEAALVDPIIKYLYSFTFGWMIEKLFWYEHDISHVSQIIIDSIGTAQLPKPEVYSFWLNWIERQQLTESEKEELIEELSEGKLFGKPLEIRGQFNPDFVKLMLIDMGIANIDV